jgi:hypothetical protein
MFCTGPRVGDACAFTYGADSWFASGSGEVDGGSGVKSTRGSMDLFGTGSRLIWVVGWLLVLPAFYSVYNRLV